MFVAHVEYCIATMNNKKHVYATHYFTFCFTHKSGFPTWQRNTCIFLYEADKSKDSLYADLF